MIISYMISCHMTMIIVSTDYCTIMLNLMYAIKMVAGVYQHSGYAASKLVM